MRTYTAYIFFEPWFKVQTLPILAPYLLNLSTHLFNKTTNFNRRLLGASLIYTTQLHTYNKKSVKIHYNKIIIKQNKIYKGKLIK